MNKRYKYPRTKHLPWSLGITSDDKVLSEKDIEHLNTMEVIVTEKMDGENTTIYSNYIHARSLDSAHHSSRAWVKALQNKIGYKIPKNMRICGENLFARHSIIYDNLSSYFMVFNIWNNSKAISWAKTVEWCENLTLSHVPVLYKDRFEKNEIHKAWIEKTAGRVSEGYVVRPADKIDYNNWTHCVGKYVRKNHIKTDEHWMKKTVIPNKLK